MEPDKVNILDGCKVGEIETMLGELQSYCANNK